MAGTRSSSTSPVPVNNSASGDRNGTRARTGAQRSTASSSTYEDIMQQKSSSATDGASKESGVDAVGALSARLVAFRKWLTNAGVSVHPAICIVNGEATDGTRNAPVLVFGPPTGDPAIPPPPTGRLGVVDGDADQALYDRSMGCQIRAAREMKQGEVIMTMPRSAFVTPDLMASSDAGRAVLACCRAPPDANGDMDTDTDIHFWDVLENTALCEEKHRSALARNTGPQLLFKILQERKKGEAAFNKRQKDLNEVNGDDGESKQNYTLADVGVISTRAPALAFLIHQRFSDSADPSVASSETLEEFRTCSDGDDGNALMYAKPIVKPLGSLDTFAPYARTLPSSVSIPLCWKRNELALLAGCIPGAALLQDVASSTTQLALEFVALLEAGILERFPKTFPEGLLTWDRWVWAAAVFSSRTLPVSCYINKDDKDASSFAPDNEAEFQSQPEVWQELGVMIPLLDMTNHEVEENQVSWKPCIPASDQPEDVVPGDDDATSPEETHPPRAILHKKVRKGSELYICYGQLGNQHLILQYGFAQLNNALDEVRMGWGLADAVGNVDPPENYSALVDMGLPPKHRVFESSDADSINAWWSAYRLEVLEGLAFKKTEEDSFMSMLKSGRKMTVAASSDGTYDPFFLMAALVATMPGSTLTKYSGSDSEVVVTKLHQRSLRDCLLFTFTRKLEKLLQNLENGLKAHFGNLKLWTKASEGGLKYKRDESSSDPTQYTGWQTFFDSHAYSATMEVEKRYYAMGPDSCVLTLYDGQLRALQASIDGVADAEKFQSGVLRQLEDLDFEIATTGDDASDDQVMNEESASSTKSPSASGNDKKSKTRRRNRKKSASTGERPPAMKLHIGNLSYSTTPSDLYDSFSKLYGTDNILECHIPIERDTGRSRGFGFVTMPESFATKALQSGSKHEIDGRLLKVARSNSAGSTTTTSVKAPVAPPPATGDRCGSCGYRPKYCVCQVAKVPGPDSPARPCGPSYDQTGNGRDQMGNGRDHMGNGRDQMGNGRDYSYYGSSGRHSEERPRDEPPYHRERGEEVDRYGRAYGRDSRSHRYDERGEDRHRDRSRHDDRRRSRDRSRSSGRGSSRYREYESTRTARSRSPEGSRGPRRERVDAEGELNRSRKRSPSRSRERSRERSRKKKSKKRQGRSRSRSVSPPRVK
jgi:RNA recognition motif-containing protein